MNLIDALWIPIRRADGTHEPITPWQITDQHATNPVIAIHTTRSDFDGALIQALIGLEQTTTAIEMEADWEDLFFEPPTPEQLKAQYAPIAHAFELDGGGPRFMQDFDLPEGETKDIAALLIESPGDNGLRNNLDHFIKRGHVEGMCPSCATAALFTLQTNAPSGGVGHRTSLRGGGPLTTLVMCDPRATGDEAGATLWRDIWLNVLAPDQFLHASGNASKHQPPDTFPWLAPTRTSGKDGRDTTPDDVHPAQMFWAMPRRIRLDFEQLRSGRCDICGMPTDALVTQFITRNYGVNYTGPWLHPLAPYTFDKQKMPLPRHAQPGGLGYRHWLGRVHVERDDETRKPAQVVTAYARRMRKTSLRLHAFGYDMDNMKARCWYDASMPLYQLPGELHVEFGATVSQLVQAAALARVYLLGGLKDAWFSSKAPGRKHDMAFISQAFWQNSEAEFYEALQQYAEALQAGQDSLEASLPVQEQWHRTLCRQALALFDQWANSDAIAHGNPSRIAQAYNQLFKSLYGPKLCRNTLNLHSSPKGELRDVSS